MSIEVTNVKVRPITSEKSKVVAFVDIVLNDAFCVTNIKIINGSKGIFMTMPSTKDMKSGEFRDICFPINKETRKIIEDRVLEQYYDAVKGNDKKADNLGF